MPFSDFTNPYQNPANIPQNYRQHINLLKLFKADGSYVRPAEDPVTMWALQILVEEYGVPLEAMELELNSDFAEGTYQSGRRYQGRVDIVGWRLWNQVKKLAGLRGKVGSIILTDSMLT
ncbi:hypothetical protein H6G97_05285 [Nostoc flagelliforme FACHB-838]|uniref:Uncharacterized protein n=1 Tax=Nostoc flagelliforme FACHB-838 TaxID=2692904 RepID=A0ABR8DHJ8_9NOSO|nr:hypothetical protein [Nostoc flagelliforme]MBD2529012.1 hypothetical protein [Nostoc flagelliforme FACHB-838]